MANEVQTIDNTAATSGYWQACYDGKPTGILAWDISSGDLQAALETVCGSGNISVSGSQGAGYTLTFGGSLANTNVPQVLVVGDANCSAITSATTTDGPNTSTGTNQQWRFVLGAVADGGTLRVSDGTTWSSAHAFASVQTCFDEVYGSGNTSVTIETTGQQFLVEFVGSLALTAVDCPHLDLTTLTSSGSPIIDPNIVQFSPLDGTHTTTHAYAGGDLTDSGGTAVTYTTADAPAFTLYDGYSANFYNSFLSGSDSAFPSGHDEFVLTCRVKTPYPAATMMPCGYGNQTGGQTCGLQAYGATWNVNTFSENAAGGTVETDTWQDIGFERLYDGGSGTSTINLRVNGVICATLNPSGDYSITLGSLFIGDDIYSQAFFGLMREIAVYSGTKTSDWWTNNRNNVSDYSTDEVAHGETIDTTPFDPMAHGAVALFLPGFGMYDDSSCTNFVTTPGDSVGSWKNVVDGSVVVAGPAATLAADGSLIFTGSETYTGTIAAAPQGSAARSYLVKFSKPDNDWTTPLWMAFYGTSGVCTYFGVQYYQAISGMGHAFDFDFQYSAVGVYSASVEDAAIHSASMSFPAAADMHTGTQYYLDGSPMANTQWAAYGGGGLNTTGTGFTIGYPSYSFGNIYAVVLLDNAISDAQMLALDDSIDGLSTSNAETGSGGSTVGGVAGTRDSSTASGGVTLGGSATATTLSSMHETGSGGCTVGGSGGLATNYRWISSGGVTCGNNTTTTRTFSVKAVSQRLVGFPVVVYLGHASASWKDGSNNLLPSEYRGDGFYEVAVTLDTVSTTLKAVYS